MSMLEVRNLTKRFGGLVAVNSLTFDVEQGDILGLIGPNGSGKTTTFNMLSGAYKPTEGTITYNGERLDGLKANKICKKGLTRTFQVVQPFPDLTAVENVMIGAFSQTGRGGEARERAMAVLKRVSMEKDALKLGKELTLLQLKRLEIAKALATEPKLLLLDEVAAGLTSTEIDDVLELINQLHSEGITFIVIEHVLKVIVNLSHRIIVIDFGKEISRGTPDEVMNDPAVHAAYLGEEATIA
ncbi:MAG: ABC transporter ATP-binding protein [Actinobacteria bacterium]|nr:ABC transporter ATP-binding protein [Actinomycetota bacterium]